MSDLGVSLLIQDLRMGKLQSKHGKKAADSCSKKLPFDCITRAKETSCVKNEIIDVFCLSVSGATEACKRRENPEGKNRSPRTINHKKKMMF